MGEKKSTAGTDPVVVFGKKRKGNHANLFPSIDS